MSSVVSGVTQSAPDYQLAAGQSNAAVTNSKNQGDTLLGIHPLDTGPTGQQSDITNSQVGSLDAQRQQILKQLGDLNLLTPGLMTALGVEKGQNGDFIQTADTGIQPAVTAGSNLSAQQFGDLFAADPEQQQINSLLRKRQIAALNGNAPTDPTLERNLQLQENDLRSKLQAQLGPGYETTSAGAQALADFKTSANEQRFNANQTMLTNAASINAGNYTTGLNAGISGLQPASLAANLRHTQFGDIFAASNLPNQTNALLGTNAAGYTAPFQDIFANTQLGAQANLTQSGQRTSMFGDITKII